MIRMRPLTFETNSSLTNALILFDKDTYKKWEENLDLYISIWEDNSPTKLYTREEATLAILGDEAKSDDDYLSEHELKYEGFVNSESIYENYEIKTLDLESIGQDYIVVSACREDR